MKPLSKLFVLSTLLLFLQTLNGCQKENPSSFKLNKHEYSAGDYLDFVNLSDDTRKHIWTVSDISGKVIYTKREANPDFRLGLLLPDGTYFLSLYDNERKFKKNEGITKEFSIASTKSDLYIYVNSYITYRVNINGEIMGYYKGAGNIKYNLPVGAYVVTLTNTKLDVKSESHTASIVSGTNEYLEFD